MCFALVSIGAISIWFLLSDMCGNEVISEYPSPDKGKKIVVFQRACGATTGLSTQASVLPFSKTLLNKAGNLYISNTDLAVLHGGSDGPKVTWTGNRSVVLTHHSKTRVLKAETEVSGVQVSYATAE